MRAIVGIEIPIDRLEGKPKASQDEALQDRLGTVKGLQQRPDGEARLLAALVKKAVDADAPGQSWRQAPVQNLAATELERPQKHQSRPHRPS